MDEKMVKRYYELNETIKTLENEKEYINKIIKCEMKKNNLRSATVGKFLIELKVQDRSVMDNSIVNYLKKSGFEDLIVETYDINMFKKLRKAKRFDENKLKEFIIEKLVYTLHVKPNSKV